MIKESNKIENEIIFIERTLSVTMNLKDRVLFLINRLYKNFYDDLSNQRTTINDGITRYNHTLDQDIEINNFLNKYGNEDIKTHILNYLGWGGTKVIPNQAVLSFDPKADYFALLNNQFHIQYTFQLNHFEPRFLNNKEFILFSPFIFSKQLLIDLINYELSIINTEEIDYYRERLISVFHEISMCIGSYIVWDLYNEGYRVYETSEKDKHFANDEEYYNNFFEMAQFYNLDKRKAYSLLEVINEIKNIDVESIRKTSVIIKNRKRISEKIKYSKSPLKLSALILEFFKLNNFRLDDNQIKKINRFLKNCFEFNSKYPTVNEHNYKTINFFTKKTFKPFVALLIYLHKKEILEFKNPLTLSKTLIQEFKELNKNHIGLSGKLRDIISQELMTSSKKELVDIVGFDNSTQIDAFLIN